MNHMSLPDTVQLAATVDLSAIRHNVRRIREISNAPQVMAVVKADGYNHGMVEVARAALSAGADQLGVTTLEEALTLREAGVEAPILAWLWTPDQDVAAALAADIDLGVATLDHLEAVVAAAQGGRPRITVKVDTGMSRQGLNYASGQWSQTLPAIVAAQESVTVTGLFTHFASADAIGDPSIDMQAERFRSAITEAREAGLEVPVNHASNSAATLTRPDLAFDLVRPGIAIYGLEPIPGLDHGLRPAMTLSARVVSVKDLPSGEAVSYGRSWSTDEDTHVAVVPFGYADGMSRALSGRCSVSIGGRRYDQVGRVCMDQFVVEVDEHVHPGDEAVIFGNGLDGGPTADELAETLGTINYEIVTMPHNRVHRNYVDTFPPHGIRTLMTADDTRAFGAELGASLSAGDLVILDGPLGAGKTTLTQGIAAGMKVRGRVTSPTFTIAREHRPLDPTAPGACPLVHVDLYRLLDGVDSNPDALLDALESVDLDTDLEFCAVVAEWGGGLAEQLSDSHLLVSLDRSAEDDSRTVTWRRVRPA